MLGKMSCKLAYWILTLSCLTVIAQADEPAGAAARDPAGFLPVPNAPTEFTPAPVPVSTVSTPVAGTNPPAPASATAAGSYVLDDQHKLTPGDRVSFQIVEDRTNAVPLLVAESAELDIPYLGRVSVKDKTCRQLAEEIKAALEKDYYYRATVIIGLDALSRVLGRVYIFGPVRAPGPVEIPANENFTTGKAIMKAGGFGEFANPKKVQVIRKTATGNTTFTVNLLNVLKKGMTEADVTLEPDDFIIVPESKINFGW